MGNMPFIALSQGRRVFYTTPEGALKPKLRDFRALGLIWLVF